MANPDDTERDLDAPTPPGGPLRQDAPSGDVNPAPVPTPETGEDPQTPRPSTTHPDGLDPQSPSDAERGGAGGPGEAAQLENAETSLDEPSDSSGGE